MKKQSESEAKPNVRKLRNELIRIGAMMSNLCYNVKQMREMPENVRRPAQELQESWDKVRGEIANAKYLS